VGIGAQYFPSGTFPVTQSHVSSTDFTPVQALSARQVRHNIDNRIFIILCLYRIMRPLHHP
jgi:hypothetical protein